jgi:thioredoxin 2
MSTADGLLHVLCPACGTTNRVQRGRLGDGPACGSCRRPLFPGKPLALDAAAFERHVKASESVPLVVDFWAAWCGPCRMMAPAFEQAAARVAPGVRLAKLDTEAEQAIAARYGIRSIPTLVWRAESRAADAVDRHPCPAELIPPSGCGRRPAT